MNLADNTVPNKTNSANEKKLMADFPAYSETVQ